MITQNVYFSQQYLLFDFIDDCLLISMVVTAAGLRLS